MALINYNKKIRYKVLSVVLSVLIILSLVFNIAVSAEDGGVKIHIDTNGLESPPDITSAAAILMNAETGDILYEKNSQRVIFPASTVKIMTAVVVMENVEDLKSEAIISKYVVDHISGNSMDPKVVEGEVFTVEDLLHAMLLWGANDAAYALAEYVSGSVSDFVAEMNKKAVELGCTDTVFANPTGMHSADMHTTVSDMAKIAFHASKIQKIMDISSLPKYTIEQTNKDRDGRTMINRNHFIVKGTYLQYYYEYASGINYGYTPEAGYCLTTVAQQTGLSYLCILMGATSTPIPDSDSVRINCFSDAKSLFEWVFSIYSYKTVISTKSKIESVEIKLSANRDNVTLVPDVDIPVLLPQNADIDKEITTNCEIFEDALIAPVEKGQHMGNLTVIYKDEVVGTAKLLSNADVERSLILYILEEIKEVVSGNWFKASVVIFFVIFAFYIAISLTRKNKKEYRRRF